MPAPDQSATRLSRGRNETDLTETGDGLDADERHKSPVRILLGYLRDCPLLRWTQDLQCRQSLLYLISIELSGDYELHLP